MEVFWNYSKEILAINTVHKIFGILLMEPLEVVQKPVSYKKHMSKGIHSTVIPHCMDWDQMHQKLVEKLCDSIINSFSKEDKEKNQEEDIKKYFKTYIEKTKDEIKETIDIALRALKNTMGEYSHAVEIFLRNS